MALNALFATTSVFRSVPLVASVVVHAGVAATLLVSAGHAQAGQASSSTAILETVDVDVAPEIPATPPAPEEKETPANDVASPTPPAHTHDYPVAPSHDAHPHDPSQPHDHATPDTHAHEEPAAAAPVATTEAPLPRFTIPSGAAQTAPGGATSSTGTGTTTAAAPAAASAPADDVVVPVSSVQVAAKAVSTVVAAYPVDARADEVEGDVQLEIVVDREGRVVEARVTRAAGHGMDESALQAIRRYRFSPAMREGRAVRVRMPWSVQFRLR